MSGLFSRKALGLLVAVFFLSFGGRAALADSVADQINSAISSGNFQAVQALVAANPAAADMAVQALISSAQGNLGGHPDQAAQAMAAASALAVNLSAAGAAQVAGQVQALVNSALAGCGGSCSGVSTSVASVLNSAEGIAQVPVVVAAAPQLFSQITIKLAQSSVPTDSSGHVVTQLAQNPNFKPQNQDTNQNLPSAE
jgi:hypothetical protein